MRAVRLSVAQPAVALELSVEVVHHALTNIPALLPHHPLRLSALGSLTSSGDCGGGGGKGRPASPRSSVWSTLKKI